MPELLKTVVGVLEELAPPCLAESWDNVGLLVGDGQQPVDRILTCLTLTPDVADEAIASRTQLIVSHHPILFRPVQRITSAVPEGALLLRLIAAGVAVYSPHTAFDSAPGGINQQLAEALQLTEIAPLRPIPECLLPGAGSGRRGELKHPVACEEMLQRIRSVLKVKLLEVVGPADRLIRRVAIGCGSAGEFLPDAVRAGCDLFLTGESRFHTSLEARQSGIVLVLAGHYATERPGIEILAHRLQAAFPGVVVRASESETNPLCWSGGP